MGKQKFCFNDICDLHQNVGKEHFRSIMIVTRDDKEREIMRHEYRDREGNTLFFCGTCHQAIQTAILGIGIIYQVP